MKKFLSVLAFLAAAPAGADTVNNERKEWQSPYSYTSVFDQMSLKEKAYMRILLIEFVYACNGKQSRLMPKLIAAHSKIDETIVPIISAARNGNEPKGLDQLKAGEKAAYATIARNGAVLCESTAEWLTINITSSQ